MCQPWVFPALGARDASETSSSMTAGSSSARTKSLVILRERTTSEKSTSGQDRLPSLTRLSAIVQPCTMSTPDFFGFTVANSEVMSDAIFSGFDDSWSMNPLWPFSFTTKLCSS